MPPRGQARMGLLDSVIVLILACMVVLIVLWINAQIQGLDRFGKLPEWLTKTASSFWTYLTGTASSSLLAFLRSRSSEPKPNYLVWIFGTAIVILLTVFGAGLMFGVGPRRDGSDNRRALLRFSLESGARDHPNLSFFQKHPVWRDTHTIGAEPDGHYQEFVDFPGQGGRFYASTVRVVTTSSLTKGSLPPSTEICFKRTPRPPGNGAPLEIRLDCPEGRRCSISRDDPGWIEICPAESDWAESIRLVPVVYADSSNAQSGWTVPSLETLRKMTDRERVGYSEFTIKSAQLSALRDANLVQYLIKVNRSPLYVDGWGPEDMVRTFDPTQDFVFSFGLENLSFSGADNGCENIEVALLFRQNDRVIKQAVISRKYAALRDADPEEMKAQDGTTFTWSGRYVKPKKEDRAELFILSTPDLREAKAVKARIDAAKLTYDGMEVVGVLRPPLDNPQYGIVAGLRQTTGQIRFTYDTATEQKLQSWIMSQRAQNKKLFRGDAFLYQLRPGDSGTGRRRSCSAGQVKP